MGSTDIAHEPGVIRYTADGSIICEECGNAYQRVTTHARLAHHISAAEYKQKYGYCAIKGIITEESRAKSRVATLKHKDSVVAHNLIKRGAATRYTKGSSGRTKNLVRPQVHYIYKERAIAVVARKKVVVNA